MWSWGTVIQAVIYLGTAVLFVFVVRGIFTDERTRYRQRKMKEAMDHYDLIKRTEKFMDDIERKNGRK